MTFADVNNHTRVPTSRDATYIKKRYVMQRIVRTWLTLSPEDSCWFDTENIYKFVKDDLINKLRSFSFGPHHDFIGI